MPSKKSYSIATIRKYRIVQTEQALAYSTTRKYRVVQLQKKAA